jgi:hypothetical protein
MNAGRAPEALVSGPVAVARLGHDRPALFYRLIHIDQNVRNDVPIGLGRQFNRYDLGVTVLHVEGQETTRRANLKDALPSKWDVSDVSVDVCPQVETRSPTRASCPADPIAW